MCWAIDILTGINGFTKSDLNCIVVEETLGPSITENIRVANPRLIDCPIVLIVPTKAEAIPYIFLGTELIIELAFGDENNPKPIPPNNSPKITKLICVFWLTKASKVKPRSPVATPMVVIVLCSILSDNLPPIGDRIAWAIDLTIKIEPAIETDNKRISWR